jgi:hypothetical protein
MTLSRNKAIATIVLQIVVHNLDLIGVLKIELFALESGIVHPPIWVPNSNSSPGVVHPQIWVPQFWVPQFSVLYHFAVVSLAVVVC